MKLVNKNVLCQQLLFRRVIRRAEPSAAEGRNRWNGSGMVEWNETTKMFYCCSNTKHKHLPLAIFDQNIILGKPLCDLRVGQLVNRQ